MNATAGSIKERVPAASGAAPPSYWKEFDFLTRDLEVEISNVAVEDGAAQLYVYEAGSPLAPPVVLINPAEAPFLIMSRLFNALSRQFRVIAWEDPGSPFMPDGGLPWAPSTMARMSGDLLEILHARGIHRPHVVTWCAGALVYLWSFAAHGLSTASLSLIAPPGIVSRRMDKTPFQSLFLPMILQLASGHCVDEASMVRRIRALPKQQVLLDDLDRTNFALTQLPVRDDIALRRYAYLIKVMCSELPPRKSSGTAHSYADVLDEVCRTTRVALLHCQDDEFFSINCSRDVAARHSGVRFTEYPTGGHFVLFREPEMLAADIASCVCAGGESLDGHRKAICG